MVADAMKIYPLVNPEVLAAYSEGQLAGSNFVVNKRLECGVVKKAATYLDWFGGGCSGDGHGRSAIWYVKYISDCLPVYGWR
jgi:hypothetical protein